MTAQAFQAYGGLEV